MDDLNRQNIKWSWCGGESTASWSRILTTVVCAYLCAGPVLARPYENSVPAEDAAVSALLRSDAIPSEIKSFCVNGRLQSIGVDKKAMFAKPLNDSGSPATRRYLRDLKTVAAKSADLPTRDLNEASLHGTGFSIREATFEECTEIPTVRLRRPMAAPSVSIVFAVLDTKCGSSSFGVSFRRNKEVWVQQHVAYYYPIFGPPGCQYYSQVVPGGATDKLFILQRGALS